MVLPGVNVRAVDGFGMSALQYAIMNGDATMLATLLVFDADGPVFDVHAKDMWGNSPADMVQQLPDSIPLFDHMRFLIQAYNDIGEYSFHRDPTERIDPDQVLKAMLEAQPELKSSTQTASATLSPSHVNDSLVSISTAGAAGWATLNPPVDSPPLPSHVEVVDARNTSLREVVRRFVAAGRPVVIRNALGECAALEKVSREQLATSEMSQLRFRVVDGTSRNLQLLGKFINESMPRVQDAQSAQAWKDQVCGDNKYIAHHFEAGWKESPRNQIGTDVPPRMEPVSSVLDCIPANIQEYFQLVVGTPLLLCITCFHLKKHLQLRTHACISSCLWNLPECYSPETACVHSPLICRERGCSGL